MFNCNCDPTIENVPILFYHDNFYFFLSPIWTSSVVATWFHKCIFSLISFLLSITLLQYASVYAQETTDIKSLSYTRLILKPISCFKYLITRPRNCRTSINSTLPPFVTETKSSFLEIDWAFLILFNFGYFGKYHTSYYMDRTGHKRFGQTGVVRKWYLLILEKK